MNDPTGLIDRRESAVLEVVVLSLSLSSVFSRASAREYFERYERVSKVSERPLCRQGTGKPRYTKRVRSFFVALELRVCVCVCVAAFGNAHAAV